LFLGAYGAELFRVAKRVRLLLSLPLLQGEVRWGFCRLGKLLLPNGLSES